MNRKDLLDEFSDILFALVPAAIQADDIVSLADVESLRQRLVKVCDLVQLKVTADNEFTSDDAVDEALDVEVEVGRD